MCRRMFALIQSYRSYIIWIHRTRDPIKKQFYCETYMHTWSIHMCGVYLQRRSDRISLLLTMPIVRMSTRHKIQLGQSILIAPLCADAIYIQNRQNILTVRGRHRAQHTHTHAHNQSMHNNKKALLTVVAAHEKMHFICLQVNYTEWEFFFLMYFIYMYVLCLRDACPLHARGALCAIVFSPCIPRIYSVSPCAR